MVCTTILRLVLKVKVVLIILIIPNRINQPNDNPSAQGCLGQHLIVKKMGTNFKLKDCRRKSKWYKRIWKSPMETHPFAGDTKKIEDCK